MAEFLGSFGFITFRSVVSIIALFFLTKLIGPRQIAQLTFYDYIIGISVGSIAAAIAIERDISLWVGLWAMIVYIGISYLMAWSGNKSIKARRFFSGTPKVLVHQGKIVEENLKSQNLDLNDLLSACRTKGFFNLDDLDCVIMESNGNLSFLPKSAKAPLTPGDMVILVDPVQVMANVIIDGKVMENHLESIGKNGDWLKAQLLSNNAELNEILLAIGNEKGDFYCYFKNQEDKNLDLFD